MFHPTLHLILQPVSWYAHPPLSLSAGGSAARFCRARAQSTWLTVFKEVSASPCTRSRIPSGNHNKDICHFDKPD